MKSYSLSLRALKIVAYILVFFVFNTSAEAKNNLVRPAKPLLSVSPAILNISLSPGKVYEYDITVQNLLNTPLPLRARLDAIDTDPSPLLAWTTVAPKDNIIPAKSTQKIHLTVKLPSKISLGGYYATLFLEPVLPRSDSSVQARVGVIILASIGVRDKITDAEITEFKTDSLIYEKGPVTALFGVKNMSLYHFSAKPILTISSLLGKKEQHILDEKIILPGKTRHWEAPIDLSDYRGGIYQVHLGVSVGEGTQIVKTIYVFAFPYSNIIYIAIIAGLILFVFIKRKNLKKTLRILIGKTK